MDRRDFVGLLAVAGLAGTGARELRAQEAPAQEVTRKLAHWIVTSKPGETTAALRKEAARTLLNWVACAVGGSHHEALDMAISALAPFSGPAQATVLGRKERLDVMHAALANGMSSHVFDFDDTHLRTIIHPAGPVASAILALAEYELRVHRLALELTGRKTPQSGADTKYSVYHAAAVAVIYGMAGEKQFSDSAARDPATIALRDRVTATADSSVKEEQARAAVIVKDGRRLEKFIENAIGSVKNPMTDAMLEAKFLDLADGILPQARARRLMDLCWKVETLASAADIAKAGAA